MSKALSVGELQRKLERESAPPVVLVIGAEPALRARAVASLRAPFEAEAESGNGSIERLDGTEVGLDAVLDEARSLPLFAMMAGGRPARLVHVSRFDRIAVDDVTPLQSYLDDPVTETVLLIEAEKLDKRTAVYKALAKGACVVACDPLERDGDARAWIEATAKDRGYRIERGAVVYLTEMTGTSLTRLEQDLEKAMLYVGESGTIRAEDLEGLLGRSREHSVFELTDSLVEGDAASAMRLLNALVDDGEEPIRLLAMIAWITRQLVTAHDLGSRGLPRKQVLEQLAGRWNQRGQILDRARRARGESLVEALAACADADTFVKRLRDSRPGGDRLRPARGRLEALCRQICAA